MLVHGLGVTSRYWARLRRELRGPSFAPDLPRGPLRAEELAAELLRRLDDAGIDRASVVANSLGCQTAAELALREPERVASLVFVGPTGDPRARTRLHNLVRFVATSVFEQPSLDFLVAREYLSSGPLRTFRQARELVRHPFLERLADVRCPALVIRGRRDAICPQDWAERIGRTLDARVAVLPGAHAVHWSHPARVARLVQEFQDGVGERGG